MRLVLWVPRVDHLRALGPVADAARRRGITCRALLAAWPPDDPKAIAALHAYAVESALGCDVAVFTDGRPRCAPDEWIVAVGLRGHWSLRQQVGGRWASLPYRQEELLSVLRGGRNALRGWEVVTTASEDGVAAARHEGPVDLWTALSRFAVIGDPILDPVPSLDRAACRKKWNLPTGRPVIFLGTAARPAHLPTAWASAFYGGRAGRAWCRLRHGASVMPYREVMRLVRAWADRNGAMLIAKTRMKHRDPSWLPVDVLLSDGPETYHPFATLELLAAADGYVGFASSLAVEATACGLAQHHLLAWPSELVEVPEYLPLRRHFYEAPDGLWNGTFANSYQLFDRGGREAFMAWAAAGGLPRYQPNADAAASVAPVSGRLGGAADRFLNILTAA